jgi:hypothetical protein
LGCFTIEPMAHLTALSISMCSYSGLHSLSPTHGKLYASVLPVLLHSINHHSPWCLYGRKKPVTPLPKRQQHYRGMNPIVGRVCYTRGYFQGRGSPHSPLVELFNKLNSILVTL